MELIPKALVAGMFVQGQIVSTGPASIVLQQVGAPVTRDSINRIWSDVVKDYPYQSLQFEPAGAGAAFVGTGPDEAVVIQPPLVQVRDPISLSVRQSAEKAAFVFGSVVHHIGGAPPSNLGVKLIYHAPAPNRGSVEFLLSEMVGGHDDVQHLAGTMEYQASVKYVLKSAEVSYTLWLEPLYSNLEFIFIDLDAQFPGVADVTQVAERVTAVATFMSTRVKTFLDRREEGWSK